MKLSIIIPAHNEEHRLPPMLEAYAAFFTEKYGDQVELIVVPNFCDDRTSEVAGELQNRFPIIRVLDDPGQVGKGGAVILGAREAKGDLIGFVDADGSTAAEAFDDLVEHIGSAGCIIASRWMKGSVVEPRQPLSRRIASRIFNTLVRLMFGFRVSDLPVAFAGQGEKLLRIRLVHIGRHLQDLRIDLDGTRQLARGHCAPGLVHQPCRPVGRLVTGGGRYRLLDGGRHGCTGNTAFARSVYAIDPGARILSAQLGEGPRRLFRRCIIADTDAIPGRTVDLCLGDVNALVLRQSNFRHVGGGRRALPRFEIDDVIGSRHDGPAPRGEESPASESARNPRRARTPQSTAAL